MSYLFLNTVLSFQELYSFITEKDVSASNRLRLDTFNLEKILCAAPLSGSEGKEFDCDDDNSRGNTGKI